MSYPLKEIFLVAADRVERGWTQGDYGVDALGLALYPESGYALFAEQAERVCAAGAIYCGIGEVMASADVNEQAEAVGDAIHALTKHTGCIIATWNDHPARTQAEVATALRGAAEAVAA